jgi:polysaccharide deacetylase family protein (PEP-CTERM system associated)
VQSDPLKNGISVDVEEFYHASNLAPYLPKGQLPNSRLEGSLNKTLEIFARHNVKGTFFTLGEVARDHPQLVRRVAELGHEIASHSFNHRCIYELSPSEFREQASSSKKLLEDLTGQKVLGFRAPNFSITSACPWAHEILVESGYAYDSSVYPVHHPRYSNPRANRAVHKISTPAGPLTIVPLATFPLRVPLLKDPINLPIAGGAYWRLIPDRAIRAAIDYVNKSEQAPCFCYFHPWELDAEQPRLIPRHHLTHYRHHVGIKKLEAILDYYFSNLSFSNYSAILGLS